MRVKGFGGWVKLDEHAVTFEFKGLTTSRVKKAASPRRIELSSVWVAEFQEPHGMTLGHLRVWLKDHPSAYVPPDPNLDVNCLQHSDLEGMRHVAVEINRRIDAPMVARLPGGRLVRTDFIEAMTRAGLTLGAGKEIKHLPELLTIDERVIELAAGKYRDNKRLVVLTDQRLILFDAHSSTDFEDIPLHAITEVELESEVSGVELEIRVGGREAEIEGLVEERAVAIANAIHTVQARSGNQAASSPPFKAAAVRRADRDSEKEFWKRQRQLEAAKRSRQQSLSRAEAPTHTRSVNSVNLVDAIEDVIEEVVEEFDDSDSGKDE